MQGMSDKEFDDQLRKAAEQYQAPPFRPAAWDNMQQQLDKADMGSKKPYRKTITGIVLALLLGTISWFVANQPDSPERKNTSHTPVASQTQDIEERQHETDIRKSNEDVMNKAETLPTETRRTGSHIAKASQTEAKNNLLIRSIAENTRTRPTYEEASASQTFVRADIQAAYVSGTQPSLTVSLSDSFRNVVIPKDMLKAERHNAVVGNSNRKLSKAGGFRISLMLSPDFSSISLSTLFDRTGSMGSVGIEYFIIPRLSINTGVNLSRKVYSVQEYAQYPSKYQQISGLTGIDGTCKVLDIPLNLRYYALAKGTHKVYLSAGISSYVMLRERYAFQYAPPEPDYVYGVKNENKHPFDIANISIGYEKAIGRRWAIQVEPFAKIPLCNIGAAKLRLATGGVFINFSYNLNFIHAPYR